ncbi:MAG: hypothetical protein JKX78_00650 [Alteromonadaceae bacterium]|nr:hypothetical protein [Alteromonadaceae bacterium]
MKKNTITVLLLSGMAVLSVNIYAENTKEIQFNQLPPMVQKSVLKEVTLNKITKVERIYDEEAVKYEIESSTNGINKDITLAKNGDILEIEQGSDLNKLSISALAAIKHDYPKLKIDEIESVQQFYTVVEGTVNGKKVAFKVLATGDIEDDESDGEKTEHKK